MKNRMVHIAILSLCVFLFYPLSGQADEAAEEIVKVFASSVVKRNNGNPLQVGIIEIADRSIQSIEVELQFPGETLKLQFSNLDELFHTVSFGFPVLKERALVKVQVRDKGNVIFDKTIPFSPPKTWKIYDVQVSHHDLGYADYYHMMRRDVREMGIEMAMEFARKTDSWQEESRFHWTVETSEPMIQYLSRQPEELLEELYERIENGQIALGGVHNSVSTEHLGYEAMARQFYTPNRHVCDWYNTKPSKTALNTDIVGFSRALALYSKEADIPYFMFGRNSSVSAFDWAEDDAAFYWQSPDKDSEMTLNKVWHYYSPDRLVKYDLPEIAALCRRFEDHGNYPYSCILAEDSYDFGLPEFENVEGIRKWNEEYANPVLVSGTFDMYFDDLSSQQGKESFRTFDKDVPNAWADQDLTDVEYANMARRLNSGLPSVEKWATVASAVSAGPFPWTDIYQAYHGLLSWGEHTNGSYAEGPIYTPPSLDDPTAANATYYELEQEMHRDLIRETEFFKEKAETIAFSQLEGLISTRSEHTLVVNNPLVRKRSAYASFGLPEGEGLHQITDNSTGEPVPFQLKEDGSVFFHAGEVPSLGYKTYALEFGRSREAPEFQTEEAPTIETDYYSVIFDKRSGGILSLFDKTLKRELVDQDAAFKLNEYYYERFESNTYEGGPTKYRAEQASFRVCRGPLATIVISEVEAEGADRIMQKVTLYKNNNQIDFELSFDKEDSGRTLADYRNYSPRGKEGLFYCLPFDVPDFTIRHELAGGIMEPIEDQSPGSSTDYYAIQNFSDISNDEWGISLATIEPNLVEYGKPRSAWWSKGDDYEHIMQKAENSHIYLYLLNNMFFTNIRQTQAGPKKFRWSLRSHPGNWKEGRACQFGRDVANPLTAFISYGKREGSLPADSHSFMGMDSEAVLCSTLKPAEANGQGYILRFIEQSGRDQTVTVDAGFIEEIESASLTNLVEVDRDYPLEVLGKNSFRFNIPSFGLRTVRVVPAKLQLPEIIKLQGGAESDSKVHLGWDLSGKNSDQVAYFKVYRSRTPGFVPSLKTFVDNTGEPEFTDKPALNIRGWQSNVLDPGTRYYYRVQAVGVNNRPGEMSAEISIQTRKSEDADEKPNQVLGLVATLVSQITDHNYIGLYFYTNIEKDVNRYIIYRSTEKGFAEMDVRQSMEHITPHGFGKVSRPLKAYNRQLFVDEDILPFTTYYYRVAALDDAGQTGEFSREASATTTVGSLRIIGEPGFRESTEVRIVNPNNTDWEIRYATDGSLPDKNDARYTAPIIIREDLRLTASLFMPGEDEGTGTVHRDFKRINDYEVSYNTPYHDKWKGAGDITLIDNYRGEITLGHKWQGFLVNDMDVTIDLKEVREVESVAVGCLQNVGNWVFFPNYIEVFTSEDGAHFKPAGRLETIKEWQRLVSKKADLTVSFQKTRCRYIRVYAKNIAYNPVWHNFSGAEAWLFVDEILIQ